MTRVVEYRVGIDIGGTFTDLVVAGDDGTLRTKKLLSTPDDYGRGIGEGLRALMDEHAIAAEGTITAQVSRVMALSEAAEAHRLIESGRNTRGRIVLSIP